MVDVTVRLFFFGLLAFVYDDYRNPKDLTVLVLDARNPPQASDGCPIHPHTPVALYAAETCHPTCPRDGRVCRCVLEDIDLYIPNSAAAAGSQTRKSCFQTVPSMAAIRRFRGGKVRPDCLLEYEQVVKTGQPVCGHIEARVWDIHPQDVRVCKFAGVPEAVGSGMHALQVQDGKRVPDFGFKSLAEGTLFAHRQPLAEILLITTTVKVPSGRKSLELELRSFDRAKSTKIQLALIDCDGRKCADMAIANIMRLHQGHGGGFARCSNPNVGYDFEVFHDLVANPSDLHDRTVPQLPGERRAHPCDKPEDTLCDSPVRSSLSSMLRTIEGRAICAPIAVSQ